MKWGKATQAVSVMDRMTAAIVLIGLDFLIVCMSGSLPENKINAWRSIIGS